MVKIYKHFNKYNYTVLTLKVDYEQNTFTIYHGMCAPINYDVKVTKKYIKEYVKILRKLGLKEIVAKTNTR